MTLVRGDFVICGWKRHFLDIFQYTVYNFSIIFISPKCLIMHCIFALTIVQLLHNSLHKHKPDFTSCMWGGLLHQVTLLRVCSAYAVHVWYVSGGRSSTDCDFTQESTTDPWLFTTNTFIHYFDFESKHCYSKWLFSIVILFLHSTVIQSFIDVF